MSPGCDAGACSLWNPSLLAFTGGTREALSATPPPDRAIHTRYVVWHRGRRMGSLDRDEDVRRAAAYGATQTDREAADSLGMPAATFRRWRLRRRLPAKLSGRPRTRLCPRCGIYLGKHRNYCMRCGWGNPAGSRPW